MRASKQLNEIFLRGVRLSACRQQKFLEGFLGTVEELCGGGDRSEWFDHFLPGRVQFALWNLSLSGEDLPEPDSCLKCSQGIPTHCLVGDFVDCVRRPHEADNARFVQSWKLSEHQVPIVQFCKSISQLTHSFCG
ncbi:hypothetical protein [Tunturiibacter gelidiferens]|uniref:hypothetical protein n=1 Tax=Tunturiibacter gelidiferens TaxID=3069689 RepID=UPI003D9ABD93